MADPNTHFLEKRRLIIYEILTFKIIINRMFTFIFSVSAAPFVPKAPHAVSVAGGHNAKRSPIRVRVPVRVYF